jgi:hypothetical protein
MDNYVLGLSRPVLFTLIMGEIHDFILKSALNEISVLMISTICYKHFSTQG